MRYGVANSGDLGDNLSAAHHIERLSKYQVVRFYQDDRPRRVIKRGLTLEEAQAHCRREDTHGDGWFDGYEEV